MGVFDNLPYTNFHDLNLDWIIAEVKKVREEWDTYRDQSNTWKAGVDAEIEAFRTWFDNLDVSDEVRDVVNDMVSSGEFLTVTTPAITSAVNAWLQAHISQETGYVIDDTLTVSGAAADAKTAGDLIRKNATYPDITFNPGYVRYDNGRIFEATDYSYAKIPIAIYSGTVTGRTSIIPNGVYGCCFTDSDDKYISGFRNTTAGTYNFDYSVTIPDNAAYLYISRRNASASYYYDPIFENTIADTLTGRLNKLTTIDRSLIKNTVPYLINGSALNHLNANAVTPQYVQAIDPTAISVYGMYTGPMNEGDYLVVALQGFQSEAVGMDAIVAVDYRLSNSEYTLKPNVRTINILDNIDARSKAFAISFWRHLSTGEYVPLRVSTDQYCISIINTFYSNTVEINSVNQRNKNARHIPNNAATPLTILHFSDLHADSAALNRIINKSRDIVIDDYICTGDMVANTAVEISSWWHGNFMTCIGNHDTASYSSSTGYNWTALSMADRDAYYIAPFESNWNIIHTAGRSYYYKDYSMQHVRLIVMDGMLYTNPGADAAAQTAWLSDLLSSAIINNLHVLIAIHAPHGGAAPVPCNFSKYGQGTMPVNSDCNTPAEVISAVDAAISNGLRFIGYIVGHTHQDNIFRASNTQLMYTITCAAVSQTAQWIKSDQQRDSTLDAFNLVTIDTANTLVKIVRGGGADIDDKMRSRKAITFNYATGELVGNE